MLNRRTGARRTRGSPFADDPVRNPQALGCEACLDRPLCGGLHVRVGAFDCLAYCCGAPGTCDNVCPNDVFSYVDRVREVDGFDLESIPRLPERERPVLPAYVALVYGVSGRAVDFAPPVVALPFHRLIDRRAETLRYTRRTALCEAFRISGRTAIVLSATDRDNPLERWWGYGQKKRMGMLEGLARLGIAAVTTPNYSLFTDVPRWDNLHAMKRIAITWHEMVSVGLPAALHVNARAPQDWRRWRDFVGERPEVNCLAFEFATGAGKAPRLFWHADQLCGLADEVRRPLTLIVRGGRAVLDQLRESYADVCFVDATPFLKAVNRQMATPGENGRPRWRSRIGSDPGIVAELLDHNFLELAEMEESAAVGRDEDGDQEALSRG